MYMYTNLYALTYCMYIRSDIIVSNRYLKFLTKETSKGTYNYTDK